MICPGCGGIRLDEILKCEMCKGAGTILESPKMIAAGPTSRIPDFLKSLDTMRTVHISKNEDYADPFNPFSNFDVQEYISSLFELDRHKVFATMVAVKLARLSTLLNSLGAPNNESIEDTFIDAANYILLWKADYVRQRAISRPE